MVTLAPLFAKKKLLIFKFFIYILILGEKIGQKINIYKLRIIIYKLIIVDI